MNIGDYLLKTNKITLKQREKAELEHEVSGNKFGKCCLDLGFITRTELNQALKAIQKDQGGEQKVMPAELSEKSKFTFDLKFLATIAIIIISACGTYFSIMSSIDELKSANSPNRLEFEYLVSKVDGIESNGDLKLITYQLNEFKETITEIKSLSMALSPLASDLTYIKEAINKLSMDINAMKGSLQEFEDRLGKVESKSGG